MIITLGMTVLLGGTSVAALYFSGKKLGIELGMESAEVSVGGECTDIQTMVLKTPSNRLWLRRFIRMENASGPDQVRTALRIAGLLAKKNQVDLIHVSVLDSHGPTLRSQMRARSIGAEVLIALKPDLLPDMKSPAMASYYEGPVSDAGRYYGDKVVVDIDEIGAMMTAMRSVEEKPDCVSPEPASDAEAKPNDHGKKDKKADHGKKDEAKSADHGEKPAADHGEEPAKEQSFFDSMLSMVGLGGSEEKPAEDHAPATDNTHAVAEEPADAALENQGEKTASEHEAKPADEADKAAAEHEAQPSDDGDQAKAKDHEAAKQAEGHNTAEQPASIHEPVEEGKAQPVTEGHDAPAEDRATAPAEAEDHAQAKNKAEKHAEAFMPVGD
jgi:hypothetical protein